MASLLEFLLLALALSLSFSPALSLYADCSGPESDLVTNLPGQPPANFRHYAGYVKLRQEDEKALFYWFFEAQGDASAKPLILWLNGGPGCSSVAYGAAQELGPFLIRSNTSQLVPNKFAWNKVGNLLFLESPVGVGFSYSNKSEDLLKLGDKVTAEDSYTFLIEWFKKFPGMKSKEFYITGESYAGHYVPQLAEVIYERNKGANKENMINLKGFMIGNAVLNDVTDQVGFLEFAWSHAMVSDQLHHTILKECDFKKDNQTRVCTLSIRRFLKTYADIDIYSIYTPVCVSSIGRKPATKLVTAPKTFTQHDLWHRLPSGYDPCTEDYTVKYFNRPDVQRALHANVTNLYYPYTPCSAVIKNWADSASSTLPIIKKLLNAGIRIWIYSGDTDGRVPVTSTRLSVNSMKSPVKEEWRAWFHRLQVGGWVETYENGLTLATVRGAGHQVPVFRPAQSFTLLSHFISGTRLPSYRF